MRCSLPRLPACAVCRGPAGCVPLMVSSACAFAEVYSAEEKRALALITFEEKQQAENKTMAQFRDMLTKRLRDQEKE